MPSPVELSLSSLLPTLSPLPPELIQLSNSLLAQSRARASSLKPEEEIGRTYACCHIACERLGKRLALELGRPSPPCLPKVYQKLKTYLGSVLRTPVTPSRGKGGRTEDKLKENGSAASTSATGRSGRVAVSTNATPSGTGRSQRIKPTEGVTPTRQKPDAGSAVSRKRKAEEDPIAQAEAQLQLEASQATTEPEPAHEEEVRPAKKPAKTPLRRKEKHARRPTETDMDEVGPAGLQIGLGTMFQSAVDWLSEERREDYAVWKEEILRKCAEMEKGRSVREVDAVG